MYQNFNKIYRAAIYVRLSKEDGDLSSSAKLESNCELPVFFRLNRESLYLCFKIILFFRLFSI